MVMIGRLGWGLTPMAIAAAVAAVARADVVIPQFVDEAAARGVFYQLPPTWTGYAGYGIVLADLDSDDDLDLAAVGASSGLVGVFENDGTGSFLDRTAVTGIPPISAISNLSAVDWDADGDLDLLITRLQQPPKLFRNDGGFAFVDVTAASGITTPAITKGVSWGDLDGDGWVDLYVGHYRLVNGPASQWTNQLWHNNGNGTFTDIAASLGVNVNAATLAPVFFDADDDGDLDLYLSNDRGMAPGFKPNHFYRNDGGVLVEIGQQNGTGLPLFSMGVAIGDLDGNGLTDIYCTNTPNSTPPLYGASPLWLQGSAGQYQLAQSAWGVEATFDHCGWSCLFLDANHDRRLDLFVHLEQVPDTLFLGRDEPPMLAAIAEAGFADSAGLSGYCTVMGDVDDDGDLDLVSNRFGGNLQLFINTTIEQHGESGSANWARFKVVGEGHDRHGFGTIVRVTVQATTMMRHVLAGADGYLGQNGFDAHFGLGDAATMDSIEVRWPNSGSVRLLTGYGANTRWTLYPPARLGDFDGDGVVTQVDLSTLSAECGGPVVPGLEMLDMNGDGMLDGGDFALIVGILGGSAGDFDDDGDVDGEDLGQLLGAWNEPCSPFDLTGDGGVDGDDLGALLGNWSF